MIFNAFLNLVSRPYLGAGSESFEPPFKILNFAFDLLLSVIANKADHVFANRAEHASSEMRHTKA